MNKITHDYSQLVTLTGVNSSDLKRLEAHVDSSRLETFLSQGISMQQIIRSAGTWMLFLLIMWVRSASAREAERCLSTHLQDAVNLNQQRKNLYSQWSKGRSEALSDLMIQSEQLALLSTGLLEHWEAKLRAKGIHIFCDDLVAMSLAPEAERREAVQDLSYFQADRVLAFRQELKRSWNPQHKTYANLVTQSHKLLAMIEDAHDYHCMVRHILQSIARTATLAPQHVAQAQEAGEGWRAKMLINSFLGIQIELIRFARVIDEKAAPLQAEGLGIICNDIPEIDIP